MAGSGGRFVRAWARQARQPRDDHRLRPRPRSSSTTCRPGGELRPATSRCRADLVFRAARPAAGQRRNGADRRGAPVRDRHAPAARRAMPGRWLSLVEASPATSSDGADLGASGADPCPRGRRRPRSPGASSAAIDPPSGGRATGSAGARRPGDARPRSSRSTAATILGTSSTRRGGLIEIEFCAQYLQLALRPRAPSACVRPRRCGPRTGRGCGGSAGRRDRGAGRGARPAPCLAGRPAPVIVRPLHARRARRRDCARHW